MIDASHIFGALGFLFGGGGLASVLFLCYRAGKWVSTLERIETAINGPLQKQFDSVKKGNEKAQKAAADVMEALHKQFPVCAVHSEKLESLTETLSIIQRRMERQEAARGGE